MMGRTSDKSTVIEKSDEEQKVPEIKALGEDDEEDEDNEEDVAPLSDEELKQARSLRTKILKYRECFPSEMRDINFDGVAESEDLDFLEEKYNSVRMARSNSSSGPGIVGVTYSTAMFAIENMAKFSGGVLLLDGLSNNTANNKEIRDCLSEINIEYCDWSDLTTPERRLFVATLYTIYMTHAVNKKNMSNELERATTSESLPPNKSAQQTTQQTWNPPQPEVQQNVVSLNQEFPDL
jgi:hypothetical protein